MSDHSDSGNHEHAVSAWTRDVKTLEGRSRLLDRGSKRAEILGAQEEAEAMVPMRSQSQFSDCKNLMRSTYMIGADIPPMLIPANA